MTFALPGPDKLVTNLVLTGLLLALLILARHFSERTLRRQLGLTVDKRRKFSVNIRNTLIFLFLLGSALIWASEIRTFAVSLVALAVAMVIATKELILCVLGAIFRTGTNAYGVGDVIEVNGIRGQVIDQTLLGTTVMEVISSQYTGRSVTFPNSLMLTLPTYNESYIGRFTVKMLTVPVASDTDWQYAEQLLLEAAHAECDPFLEEVRNHMQHMQGRYGISTPSPEPKVLVTLPAPEVIHLLLRFPTPDHARDRLEQAILRRFLGEFQPVPPERRRVERR